jgi:hypothetical protein
VPEETAHPYMPFVTNFVEHISPKESELEQKNIELSLRVAKLENDIKLLTQIKEATVDKRKFLHEQLLQGLETITKECAEKHGVKIDVGIGASV